MEGPYLNLSGAVSDGPEDFKRPNHPDFMDSTELRKMHFSGMRTNSITEDFEVWVNGYCVTAVPKQTVALDPLAINKAMQDAFDLHNVMPDSPAARQWERLKNGYND